MYVNYLHPAAGNETTRLRKFNPYIMHSKCWTEKALGADTVLCRNMKLNNAYSNNVYLH